MQTLKAEKAKIRDEMSQVRDENHFYRFNGENSRVNAKF